jgi:pyruvate dehydrogenase E2 component (dihydrolipoamide acetyltransferase)
MPKWGLLMHEGTVTAWLHAEGDEIQAGEPLLTVETEKTASDVEAPHDGVLRRIVAQEGALVEVSGPVAVLCSPGETLSDNDVDALLAAPIKETTGTSGTPAQAGRVSPVRRAARRGDRPSTTPAARKRARELGVDLSSVAPSRADGRITLDDVERAAAGGAAAAAGAAAADGAAAAAGSVAAGGAAAVDGAAPTPDAAALSESWVEFGEHRVHVVTAGDGPPTVFLHGLGGSLVTWMTVADRMSQQRRLVLIDLPGHGASAAPDPSCTDYSLSGVSSLIANAIAAVCDGPVVIVGHSLGGAVATLVAAGSPSLVAGLVLIDPAGAGPDVNPEVASLLETGPSEATSRELLELFVEDRTLLTPTGIAEHARALARPGVHEAVQAAARGAFDGAAQRIDLADSLAGLSQPVLVIWGAEDRVFGVEQADALGQAAAQAAVRIIPGVGHSPHLEAPDEVVSLIDPFLADIAA